MEDLTASSSGSRERGGTGGRPEGWGDKMGRVAGSQEQDGHKGHVAQLWEVFVLLQL